MTLRVATDDSTLCACVLGQCGRQCIRLHGVTLSGSAPIRIWGTADMSWENLLILTGKDRFTCTEDEVVHGKTRVGPKWGRDRVGQFVSP